MTETLKNIDPSPTFCRAKLLDGMGGARDLSDEEVNDWSESDGLLWLDIDQNNERGREWLTQRSGLGENVYSILLAGETRPRSLSESNGLVVILRGINMNPGAVPDDMVAVRMSLQKDQIITSRRRNIASIEDLSDALIAGRGPKTSGEFLVVLTSYLSLRIESAVENIEEQIEALDDEMADGNVENIRLTLGVARRQAAAIRRYLSPQREALDRIARENIGILLDSDVFELREEANHLTRHIEDLDLAREHALVTQEELMNRVAHEQNQRMYVLSVVAAIFLPLTFITGVLGMNVAGLPGTVNPNGFLYSALFMGLCLTGLIVYFRWRKWL
ncbi:MAG: zinc transporter ZntB [Woeseiaceae bacterium]|nr:zinc transporter ZntB [Woeseiaceae bacterium]